MTPRSPDPTLIGKFDAEQFMGNYHFNRVIGRVESLGLGAEPKYIWHTALT